MDYSPLYQAIPPPFSPPSSPTPLGPNASPFAAYRSSGWPLKGQSTYLSYQSCQKRLVTWLVTATVRDEKTHPQYHNGIHGQGKVVMHKEVLRLADTITHQNSIPQWVHSHLDFVVALLKKWSRALRNPRTDHILLESPEIDVGLALKYLSRTRAALSPMPLSSEVDEPVEEDYSLVLLRNEAFCKLHQASFTSSHYIEISEIVRKPWTYLALGVAPPSQSTVKL